MEFVPIVQSEEFGAEEFAPQDTFKEALGVLTRIKNQADSSADSVERNYFVKVKIIQGKSNATN